MAHIHKNRRLIFIYSSDIYIIIVYAISTNTEDLFANHCDWLEKPMNCKKWIPQCIRGCEWPRFQASRPTIPKPCGHQFCWDKYFKTNIKTYTVNTYVRYNGKYD